MITKLFAKIVYIVLILLSLTILNFLWYQPNVGDLYNQQDVYLYDISYILSQPRDSQIIFFVSWFILIVTVLLFYLYDNFRYYDVIIGYVIWKMIPFISSPINIP